MNPFPYSYAPSNYETIEESMMSNVDSLSCKSSIVLFCSSDDEFIIEQQHQVIGDEDTSFNKLHDIVHSQRLRIITFYWKHVDRINSLEIGFFESGEQLGYAMCLDKIETKTMLDHLNCFNKGNIEHLNKFKPSVKFLICLLDRMKYCKILNNLQLETMLILFQQVILKYEEIQMARKEIESWIQYNSDCIEDLFLNMRQQYEWKNQSLAHNFFSLAFSDITKITRRITSSSCIFRNMNRYFNTVLAALFGCEISKKEFVESHFDENFFPELVKLLSEIHLENYQSSTDHFPQSMLKRPSIFSHGMDPRSVCLLPPAQFRKSNLVEGDFSQFLFGKEFYVSYLVKKTIHQENKLETLQELKRLDLSAYYYARSMVEIKDNGPIWENLELASMNGLNIGLSYFERECTDNEKLYNMKQRIAHLQNYK